MIGGLVEQILALELISAPPLPALSGMVEEAGG